MNISEKNMLSLVRSALWGTPAGIQEPIEWSQIIEAASRQTLLGLVASAAGKLPQKQQPEEAAKTRLQRTLFRIISSHNLLNSRLAEVASILNSNNIEYVLLKGEGLALNYPDPTIRQCGDIDLYIGPNNCLKAFRLLIAESGQEEEEVPLENAKHYHLNYKGVVIELHKIADTIPGIRADRRYQQWILKQLSGNNLRKIAGTTINLPPYNFDAIYILNHI
ncbi:MAG: nucleotidyltransferase family protein, partial [Bacteroidales bacterium]|nr:nucleotidyltransferase family protein [Bacteroidales bacterium]